MTATREVIQVVDPMGRITTTTYDNRGWVATVTDPLGNVVDLLVHGDRKGVDRDQSRQRRRDRVVFYDKDDRLIAVTDANSNTTSFGYDGVGNQIGVTDANNHTTSYAYDSMNRLTTVTTRWAIPPSTATIPVATKTVTDGLGHTATTLYDALNRRPR